MALHLEEHRGADRRCVGRPAGTGTSRGDTAGVCGGRTDTGYSFLYNYSLLRGGTHRVDVYADGQLFGTATFQVGYLGAEFLRGLSAAHRITDFPVRGQGTRVVWEESKQNFIIAGMEALTSGSLVGTYSIRNVWYQDSSGLTTSTLAPNTSASGAISFRGDGTWSLTFTITINGLPSTTSGSGTYTDGGYFINTGGETDLVIERGDTLTVFTLTPGSASSWAALALSGVRNPAAATIEAEAVAVGTTPSGIGGTLRAIGAAFPGVAR